MKKIYIEDQNNWGNVKFGKSDMAFPAYKLIIQGREGIKILRKIESDMIEIYSLFPEEDYTGKGQVITAYGMEICRYYNELQQRCVLSYIRKEQTGGKKEEDQDPDPHQDSFTKTFVSVDGK